ncbi:MAG: pyrroloquinoline quinone biosynthesis peptide chaperone PqqD, partial [Myxococcota bacterium]|nr:pyrroloquinoline quinone biosynthesis peptide chaperone PqqD [Myxococcota bacterium]
MNPRLARGVRVRPDPRDGIPVLLSPERGLRLSPTAAAVLALCDGEHNLVAISRALAQRYSAADPERIDSDVRLLLQELHAKGLVEGVPLPAPREPLSHTPHQSADAENGSLPVPFTSDAVPALETPYTLVAEVTHRCALACPYCSNPLALVRRADELTTDEWLRVVDDAATLGVMQMHLTGGEPLARSDLEVIAARGRERDLYVNLVTSGVPLDRERLERLAPSLDHVQLSVQDADPAESDRLAGHVSFEQKMRVASWVKSLGLPLTVNVVLHRGNADRASEMIAMAERLGA